MLRSVLSRAPLLSHAAFGASSAVAMTVVSSRIGPPPDAQPVAPDADASVVFELDVASILSATIVGGLQGACMRYWYPGLEQMALRVKTSSRGQTLAKIVMDWSPAMLSTAALNSLLRWWYRSSYGLPSDEAAVFDRYYTLAEGLRHEGLGAAVSDSGSAPILEMEEFELIEFIIDTQPTLANALTAAATLVNFTLVPRQFRGLFGILQWQSYESLQRMSIDAEFVEVDEGGASQPASDDDRPRDDDDSK